MLPEPQQLKLRQMRQFGTKCISVTPSRRQRGRNGDGGEKGWQKRKGGRRGKGRRSIGDLLPSTKGIDVWGFGPVTNRGHWSWGRMTGSRKTRCNLWPLTISAIQACNILRTLGRFSENFCLRGLRLKMRERVCRRWCHCLCWRPRTDGWTSCTRGLMPSELTSRSVQLSTFLTNSTDFMSLHSAAILTVLCYIVLPSRSGSRYAGH